MLSHVPGATVWSFYYSILVEIGPKSTVGDNLFSPPGLDGTQLHNSLVQSAPPLYGGPRGKRERSLNLPVSVVAAQNMTQRHGKVLVLLENTRDTGFDPSLGEW